MYLYCLVIIPFVLLSCMPFERRIYGACIKAFDGDTIQINRGGELVKGRLLFIDAPELSQGVWGEKSKEYLEKVCKRLDLEIYSRGQGYYGRELIVIKKKDHWVHLEMLRKGFAFKYPRSTYLNYSEKKLIEDSENIARSQKLGVWSAKLRRPWSYRRFLRTNMPATRDGE